MIDGKQRLTSISTFFADRLALRGLERLSGLNGRRYSELPDGIRVPLGMKSLRVTTLLRQSQEELKHEVFLRLNTGGEILNPQEIRNVAYRGPLNDLVYQLAENHFLRGQFKIIPPSSPPYRQMTDAEYVVRFFALSSGWKTFRGTYAPSSTDSCGRIGSGPQRISLPWGVASRHRSKRLRQSGEFRHSRGLGETKRWPGCTTPRWWPFRSSRRRRSRHWSTSGKRPWLQQGRCSTTRSSMKLFAVEQTRQLAFVTGQSECSECCRRSRKPVSADGL